MIFLHKLSDIIKTNNNILDKINKGASEDTIKLITMVLQYHVFTFIDNQIPGLAPSQQRNGRRLRSVCDRMKKKEGRIRGNLNGKRVDQSARSVITPDPYISIDELGVPIRVALNITFQEVVNEYNIEEMSQLLVTTLCSHLFIDGPLEAKGFRNEETGWDCPRLTTIR